ncbi:hypothetical protein [Streptomyces sp. NPDC002851]
MLKHVRICAIAAVAAGALALTGCSMDSGKKDRGGDSENSTSAGSTGGGEETPSDDSGATGGDTGTAGSLDGVWIAMNGGKPVSLVVHGGGKVVALAETGGVSCTGTAGEDGGTQMLNLKCQGGGKRESGQVKSADSTSMTVEWEGVGTDEFKKSDKGGMELPTDLPTDMPQG